MLTHNFHTMEVHGQIFVLTGKSSYMTDKSSGVKKSSDFVKFIRYTID